MTTEPSHMTNQSYFNEGITSKMERADPSGGSNGHTRVHMRRAERSQTASSCCAASASSLASVFSPTTDSSCLYVRAGVMSSSSSSSNRMGGPSSTGSAPTPCMRFMCCLRFPLRLKRAGQRSQAKGRSPVWMMMCLASCELHFLSLPQK